MHALPLELRTERLVLRAWRGDDAESLRPVLLGNQEHLRRWIPEHVHSAPPLPQLIERLDGFAAKFAAGSAFRFALRELQRDRILGGVSLFPRDATSRVPLADADRVELGYWLDATAMGQGFATEAARGLLGIAKSLPGIGNAEIHCHVDNTPSSAVPRRLGFELTATDGETQVWRRALVVASEVGPRPVLK